MAQPEASPEPFDVYRCIGCEQLLTFDAEVRVPNEQLSGCQAQCNWVLLSRRGASIVADPLLTQSNNKRHETP
jgi:hypothetical protein